MLCGYAMASYLSLFIRDLTSMSSSFAILSSVCKSGWLTLVHHLETVEGFLPSSSASHLLVYFFSTRTILNRFKSSIIQELWFKCKINEFFWDKNHAYICFGAWDDPMSIFTLKRKLPWLRHWSNRNLTHARVWGTILISCATKKSKQLINKMENVETKLNLIC